MTVEPSEAHQLHEILYDFLRRRCNPPASDVMQILCGICPSPSLDDELVFLDSEIEQRHEDWCDQRPIGEMVRRMKARLVKMTKSWSSGTHPAHPTPDYYIRWATDLGFEVPWLETACSLGLVDAEALGIVAGQKSGEEAVDAGVTPVSPYALSKQEIIGGFQLHDKKWGDILGRPARDGKRYKKALCSPGARGRAKGGGAKSSLWDAVVMARLLVECGDLNLGQVKTRFVRAWPQWEGAMIAELGDASPP